MPYGSPLSIQLTKEQREKLNLPAQVIKAHITSAITSVTKDTWTDFTGFSIITSESNGDSLELNADTKTIDISREGLYQFGGCVHYQNNTEATYFDDFEILTRLLRNSSEARCSQRGSKQRIRPGGEEAISYSGTVYLEAGDTVKLQYYTNRTNVEFYSASEFVNPVAATLWLTYVGIYG